MSSVYLRKSSPTTNGFINRYSIYDNNENNNYDDYESYATITSVSSQQQQQQSSAPLLLSSSSSILNTPNTPLVDDVFEELYSKPSKKMSTEVDSIEVDVQENIDCNKEWDKVHSILASLDYMLTKDKAIVENDYNDNSKSPPLKKSNRLTLEEFLEKLNLSKYLSNFILNGFDDTNYLNGCVNSEDLGQIGIKERLDVERLLEEIAKLSVMKKLDDTESNTVNEWLGDLNLTQYSNNFYRKNIFTISRLRQLYEIEFITLLNIRLMGHRKRMLNSLGLLKQQRHNSRSSVKTSLMTTTISVTSEPPKTPFFVVNGSKTLNSTTGKEKSDRNSTTKKSSPPVINRSKSVTFADDVDNNNNNRASGGESKPACLVDNSNKTKTTTVVTTTKTVTVPPTSPKKQANYSQYLKDYKSSKHLWKHDPEKLMKTGCNYTAQYLGSSALNRLYSNKSPIKYAIDRLKHSAKQSIVPLPSVILNISAMGVKLLHCQTNDTLWIHDIKNITSVCQDQEELLYFALITKSDPNSYHYCHVFLCQSADLSNDLILTIGQAFDLAFELFCNKNN